MNFRRLLILLTLGPTAIAVADPPLRVLLLGKELDHPYGTHMYMLECELLAHCLRQTPGTEVTVVNGWPKDSKTLEQTDVLVSYSADAGSHLLGGPHAKEFQSLVDRGVGLVCLHWSTGCANEQFGPQWRDTLGGWFDLKFSKIPVTLSKPRPATPDHPISRGWNAFDLRDEYYIGLRFHPQIIPIATAHVEGADQTVAWAFERPRGRSFGFVCGHFHEVFLDPNYRRIAVNAILWTGHRDVPSAGSPVEINEKVSTLPPEHPK